MKYFYKKLMRGRNIRTNLAVKQDFSQVHFNLVSYYFMLFIAAANS